MNTAKIRKESKLTCSKEVVNSEPAHMGNVYLRRFLEFFFQDLSPFNLTRFTLNIIDNHRTTTLTHYRFGWNTRLTQYNQISKF